MEVKEISACPIRRRRIFTVRGEIPGPDKEGEILAHPLIPRRGDGTRVLIHWRPDGADVTVILKGDHNV
jgi:hypothetical protein